MASTVVVILVGWVSNVATVRHPSYNLELPGATVKNARNTHGNSRNRSRARQRSERAFLAGYVHELSERHRGADMLRAAPDDRSRGQQGAGSPALRGGVQQG